MKYPGLHFDLCNGSVIDYEGQLFKMAKDQTIHVTNKAIGFSHRNSDDYALGNISEILPSPFIKIDNIQVDVRTVILLSPVNRITIEDN